MILSLSGRLCDWSQEAGGHRFQRVPPTERRGRIHTSTVTVAVMQSDNSNVTALSERDIDVQWYSGTGAGGQHRNKHQNSCRLFHVPTGTVAKSECRSRTASYEAAYSELSRRVQSAGRVQQEHADMVDRRRQVGTGMRGDKIRTYRLQDDQVVDHRNDKRSTWSKVERGDFERLI